MFDLKNVQTFALSPEEEKAMLADYAAQPEPKPDYMTFASQWAQSRNEKRYRTPNNQK